MFVYNFYSHLNFVINHVHIPLSHPVSRASAVQQVRCPPYIRAYAGVMQPVGLQAPNQKLSINNTDHCYGKYVEINYVAFASIVLRDFWGSQPCRVTPG